MSHFGVISSVRGSVIDVRFDGHLPPIYSVLRAGKNGRIVIEVLTQRDERHVRCIALTPTQGLARGMTVEDSGAPLRAPVGKAILSRMFDVFGDVIDRGAALADVEWRSVHRAPPTLTERSTKSEIFETGIYWMTYSGERMLYRAGLAAGLYWTAGTFLTHPWLVVASGTGGTTARDTGVRFAGFQAVTSNGDTALINGVVGASPQAPQDLIRALVTAFADARNSHDGQTVANLYSADGEWFAPNGRTVRGRPSLALFWGSQPGQVQRTIESINFEGNNVAVVRVLTKDLERPDSHRETFIVVKIL